jgi:hypothetical protein
VILEEHLRHVQVPDNLDDEKKGKSWNFKIP